MSKICPNVNCNTANPSDANYCINCGAAFSKESGEKQKTHNISEQLQIEIFSPPPVLYASSINIETETFYSVTAAADDTTIYRLTVRKGTSTAAEFEVYSGAFAKVLSEHHFLVGCDLQALGNTKVVTTQAGIAEKQDDDETWKITQQARVQFE
ncbi:MAG: zinc ribbon domain-containing protein [Prevotellaceae bacterium]|jgi:hypothetical protein|nr:zinc ribbon domain-containing protein [Prevotellaceae bacterium]